MSAVRGKCVLVLVLLGSLFVAGSGQTPAQDLPLVIVPASSPGPQPLVLILSGDGNWASFVKQLSRGATAVGSPVLGLESRSYLSRRRSPDELAGDLEATVRRYLTDWGRSQVVVIGYSRGAELAPFAVARWPDDLKARVRAIGLVGAGEKGSFEFHWIDLLRSVARPSDLPIRPELERLGGIPIVCVYGEDEQPGVCADPIPGMRVRTHAGGHRVSSDEAGVARMVLMELGID